MSETEKANQNLFLDDTAQNISAVEISDKMQDAYLQYSLSVLAGRAIPDVRDGLKPVHRRILYTMYERGLTPDKPYRKCADTVGSVLGSYHPHGDASVYDALVRLAQPFSMRYPLVDGQGNFGSIDGDPPAAYRYTEARMSKVATEMLTGIEKNTVPFMPNYDDRLKEPEVLPGRFPNLPVNGSIGIAVGMATNVPTHHLGEVIDGITLLMENPACTTLELMEKIPGPDFPTGGTILGRSGIFSAYETGRGKIVLRGETHFEQINGREAIVITEIPYMVNKAVLVEAISKLAREPRGDGIHTVRDESSREGMRIVVELKRNANPELIRNRLYQYTKLQDNVNANMVALVDGQPRTLGLKAILEAYLAFQVQVTERALKFDFEKNRKRANILKGLLVAAVESEKVVTLIRAAETATAAKEALRDAFTVAEVREYVLAALREKNIAEDTISLALDGITLDYIFPQHAGEMPEISSYDDNKPAGAGLTAEQIDAIANMRLLQLTGLERRKIIDELESCLANMADCVAKMESKRAIYGVISDDLAQLREKYADTRRTKFAEAEDDILPESLIPEKDVVVTYTEAGYVKRVAAEEYRRQNRGGKGLRFFKNREEDYVRLMLPCLTHDSLLFFSNLGAVYQSKCYEIPDGSRTTRGTNLVNFLALKENEKITTILAVKEFSADAYLVIATVRGLVKRTPLSEYKNVNRAGKRAISFYEDDAIADVLITQGAENLFLATRKGKIIHIRETDFRPMSRTGHGVRGIRFAGSCPNDTVIALAKEIEGGRLLTVSTQGYGRLTEYDGYTLQARGGQGVCNYKPDEKRGEVAAVLTIRADEDMILVTSDGVALRTTTEKVIQASRTSYGCILMRPAEGQEIVDVIPVQAQAAEESEAESEITD